MPHQMADTHKSMLWRLAPASERAARRLMPPCSQEDDRLCAAVARLGLGAGWATIAAAVGRRSGKSCRLRWHNQLDPAVRACTRAARCRLLRRRSACMADEIRHAPMHMRTPAHATRAPGIMLPGQPGHLH